MYSNLWNSVEYVKGLEWKEDIPHVLSANVCHSVVVTHSIENQMNEGQILFGAETFEL